MIAICASYDAALGRAAPRFHCATTHPMKSDTDSAHVPIPPPVMLLTSILAGVGLNALLPLPFISGTARWFLGAIFLAFGLGTIITCAWMFKKAHTAIEPWKTTSHIVT